MCTLLGGYDIDDACVSAGSISRVLIMKRESWLVAVATLGTGATRQQISAISSIPAASIYEIGIDIDGANNGFESVASDGFNTLYTQTITLTRNSIGLTNNQLTADLQDCCKFVAFVQLKTGEWIVVGVDSPVSVGAPFKPNGLKSKVSAATGGANSDTATTTYTFAQQNPNSNNQFLSLSSAAAVSVIAAIA
jgi:hypothetical protein